MVKEIGAPLAHSKTTPKGEKMPTPVAPPEPPKPPKIKSQFYAIQESNVEDYQTAMQKVIDTTDGVDRVINRLGEPTIKDGIFYNYILIIQKVEEKKKA